MIRVYSHPRSGTNYLMALLAENFYSGIDVSTGKPGHIGHWSNRIKVKDNKYGKLFGNHLLYNKSIDTKQSIYIYRDGRSVALSLFRAKQFINKSMHKMPFSEFVRADIDWLNTPGKKTNKKMNIFSHWKRHLANWKTSGVYMVRYETLVNSPYKALSDIASQFGLQFTNLVNVGKVGWFPNSKGIYDWQSFMNDDDIEFYYKTVGRNFYGVY